MEEDPKWKAWEKELDRSVVSEKTRSSPPTYSENPYVVSLFVVAMSALCLIVLRPPFVVLPCSSGLSKPRLMGSRVLILSLLLGLSVVAVPKAASFFVPSLRPSSEKRE